MADGGTKPIEQVKVGDQVENAEPGDSFVERHVVTALHVTDDDRDFVDITVLTPAGSRTIASTAHHLFWDETTHAWTNATDLEVGDQLATLGGGRIDIESVRRYSAPHRTYNLAVDSVHTYYVVAVGTPILVHNCGTGPDGLIDLDHASRSGAAADRGGYSLAGRALQKHADRPGTGANWPRPSGRENPAGWNKAGQDMLDDVLTNPGSVAHLGYGRVNGTWQDTVDVRLPSGAGARFDLSGNFSGFLD